MTEFIAEISSNHNQDWTRCMWLIDRARNIGCDGVKFQLFKTEKMFAPEVLDVKDQRGNTLRDRDAWELPLDFLPQIRAHCDRRNLKFICTPFYLEAVEELLSTNTRVDIIKIASYELLWTDLLLEVAGTGLPVVLSTGMANLEEIINAVRTLRNGGVEDLTILHCISMYPTPRKHCNLRSIQTLREFCNCKVGFSDHSVDPAVIYRAVHTYDASMIEFHFDVDGQGVDYQYGATWLAHEMRDVIHDCRGGLEADGDWIKGSIPGEEDERLWRRDPEDGLRPTQLKRRELDGS